MHQRVSREAHANAEALKMLQARNGGYNEVTGERLRFHLHDRVRIINIAVKELVNTCATITGFMHGETGQKEDDRWTVLCDYDNEYKNVREEKLELIMTHEEDGHGLNLAGKGSDIQIKEKA